MSQEFHLIDLNYAARQLRKLGDLELKYLAEVMQGETLSNYIRRRSLLAESLRISAFSLASHST